MDTSAALHLPIREAAARLRTVTIDDESDGALIERIAQGDRAAFEEIYRRFARAVLAMALRRVRDLGRAEDATQDTFAALWRSASTYNSARGPGGAWLYTVARNAIVDGLRRTPKEVLLPEPPEIASENRGPAAAAEASWQAWCVHRALESLTEQERPLIELAYFSQLSQSEIADFLRIPIGTVKTRTRSALARLADELEGAL